MGDSEVGVEDESLYGRLGIFMAAVWVAGIEETRPVLVLVLVAWAGTEIEASLGLVARVFSSSSEVPLKMSSVGSFPAFSAGREVSFWGVHSGEVFHTVCCTFPLASPGIQREDRGVSRGGHFSR